MVTRIHPGKRCAIRLREQFQDATVVRLPVLVELNDQACDLIAQQWPVTVHANLIAGQHPLGRDDNPIDQWQPGNLAHPLDHGVAELSRNLLGHVAQRTLIKRFIPMWPLVGLCKCSLKHCALLLRKSGRHTEERERRGAVCGLREQRENS